MPDRQRVLAFTGTVVEFRRWLKRTDPMRDNPELDASVARHPAGKRLGR